MHKKYFHCHFERGQAAKLSGSECVEVCVCFGVGVSVGVGVLYVSMITSVIV